MARLIEPTPAQERAWAKWVKSRPKAVRLIAERFDPWSLYRLRDTGQRVTVVAISEDGTVRVDVSGEHNFTLFDRTVFGINPDNLEPCDLPGPDELTGAVLAPDEVDDNIGAIRAMMGIQTH